MKIKLTIGNRVIENEVENGIAISANCYDGKAKKEKKPKKSK